MNGQADRRPVMIVGAGIGGLTTALALLQRGVEVAVFEQADQLGDVGAGLTMYPNATRVLEFLGLGPGMADTAVVPADGGSRHWQTGELLRHSHDAVNARETFGAPQFFMHRADLHELLARAVTTSAPGCVRLGWSFESFQESAGEVVAWFENGERVSGRALIGCDGLRSRVRACLAGPDEPRFTGAVTWRGLIPMERLSAELRTPTSCIWTGPGHAFLRYPVRRGELMNYVAHTAQGSWAEESWKLLTPVENVLAEYRGWDRLLLEVIRQTPPEYCFKWALFDRDPLSVWGNGRVTLLGDAAHPALPFLGQGAGMAIEDAMVLARCLAGCDDVPAALRRYEAVRQPRCHWVQLAARANGVRFFQTDPARDATITQHTPEQEQALRHYNAMTVDL
ncbi:MAG: FAD-dependent oxidoreductase [Dehalococcoidia bacterium]